jgi:ATP-dependent Lhr-like helicase
MVIERFFDDTGGMQLVVHSPFGGRINRGLGLALRKKFCRTFNFELQAAATDDAIVLSLGPHHSFPLDEVPRYLSSRTVRDTLEHAILDSPMFQARWRWNLNRSLMVLRFRGGKRNPPPIQRMESDDLFAAVFPQAAACQDNVVGPIELPDHLLVRQTVDDTLTEALDADGLEALLSRIEEGSVRVHCRDTTEPSVLAHEIITARPYAFLDDEEFQNRRVNAVHLRRGLNVDLAAIGSLDPEAIAQVHAEIEPYPTTPDDLHDLLSSMVATQPRPEWQELFSALAERGRARTLPSGLWATTETEFDPADDLLCARMIRGHMELIGITTVSRLSEMTRLSEGRVASALARLQAEGFAFSGQFTPSASAEEWVGRRLLARMHSYSRRSRRESVRTVTAQDFMRFLLRWQHVAPGTQLTGSEGLASIVEQLQGFEVAAVAWEREILARRLRRYEPAWLDQLCHQGDVSWLRLIPRPRDSDTPAAPSKATPIAVLFRADLPWLLSAARPEVVEPTVGATAEIIEVLRQRGASFASDLAAATHRLPEDIERGLWDGVSRGLIMCDGFDAIRARVTPVRSYATRPTRFSRLSRLAQPTPAAAGRWALVPGSPESALDPDDLAEAVAEQLLRRWGVVFRDLAQHDSLRLPWREIQWALRRLEDRGLVRGGRFVAGFTGEQYALPEAAEQLLHMTRVARSGERVIVNATDPLNLVGVIVPGESVPAIRTNRVVYVDGVVEEAADRSA